MSSNRRWRWVLLAWACIIAVSAASAYVVYKDDSDIYVIKWQRSPITMQVKLPATPGLSDGSSQRSSVAAAMDVWNPLLGTVQLTAVGSTPGAYATGNGINEIVMDSRVDGDAFPSGALAITIGYTSGNDVVESDIVFNSAYTWDSYRGNLRNDREDIRRVAVHELGHVLGLNHPDEHGQYVTAIMNSRVSAVETPQADDIAGGRLLYGAPGVRAGNDRWTDAEPLPAGDRLTATGSNIGATRESGEPLHATSTGVHSVWWRWTATSKGLLTIDTLGSNFDTVLAAYTGASVSALTEVAANDDEELPGETPNPNRKRTSKIEVATVSGTTYYLAVDGWGDADGTPTGYTGAITLNLHLVPLIAPAFASQPADTTLRAGEYAAFSVQVTGSPSPTYQWERRRPDGAWTTLTDGNEFAGTTTNHLTMATTLAMDGDQYRCVATNRAGNATSSAATLHVTAIPLPVITKQPAGATFNPDEPGELTVEATGATTFQWYQDDLAVAGQTSATLYLADPKASDAGQYHVVVTNPGGSVTSQKVTLTVVSIPVVANQGSARQVVASGASASFAVTAAGTGLLKYQWYHDGRPIAGATASSYSRVISAAGDAGAYWAAVTDDRGTRHGAPFFVVRAHGTTNVVQWGAMSAPEATQDAIGFGGYDTVCLIRQDGSLQTRGAYLAPNLSDIVAVSVYRQSSAILKSDGTVLGEIDSYASDTVPPVNLKRVQAVACGEWFGLALKTNGTVTSWGRAALPVSDLRDIVAISAAPWYALALKRDGTVVLVQPPNSGMALHTAVPANLGNVVAIAAGVDHALALKSDGTVVAWGANDYGETIVPTGLRQVVAIAAGQHSLALKADGTLVAWGKNWKGESSPPTGLAGAFAIATGYESSFALRDVTAGQPPLITSQPLSESTPPGYGVYLSAGAAGYPGPTFQWQRNGVNIAGVTTSSTWLIVGVADAGLYRVMATSGGAATASNPAIIGITSTEKVIGTGVELDPHDIRHPNGNIFDQVLVNGAAEAITADWELNQITRTSFIDVDGDIVQVEFSGPGTLSLVLDAATGPALAEKYNQPGVLYVTGHAGIVIAGANENTNVSVFTVGTATAVNQALFKIGETYDGLADIAFIAISSTDGKFGGLRAANTTFFAQRGHTGIYAPGVEFTGPVFVGDVSAFDEAQPVLVLGAAADVRITGGDMLQANGKPVEVSGIAQLRFTAGSDSHGHTLPAQANRAVYQENGVDVTARIVVNP